MDTRSVFFCTINLLTVTYGSLCMNQTKIILLISFERDCKYAITCLNKDLVLVLMSQVSIVSSYTLTLHKVDTSLRQTASAGTEGVRFRES